MFYTICGVENLSANVLDNFDGNERLYEVGHENRRNV